MVEIKQKVITQEDVKNVQYDTEKKFEDWSDEELAKLFYNSWNQIEVNEVFGISDLRHRQETRKRLINRGYRIVNANTNPELRKYQDE